MAIDREDIVFVGRVRDRDGFACDLLENPRTGARYLAYDPETHWQKAELAKLRASKRRDVPSATPRHAWPGKPGR